MVVPGNCPGNWEGTFRMSDSRTGKQYVLVTWFALLIMVAGIFPWSAAAQDGTPADEPVISETVEPDPATEEPTIEPVVTEEPATEADEPIGGEDEPQMGPASLLQEEHATP